MIVKAVVLGHTEVGKTSLCNRFYHQQWDPVTATTVSASCLRREIQLDGHDVTYCIWDTAGQERFRSISPLYYRGAHVAILVFDLTSRKSLDIAATWASDVRNTGPKGMPILIAGNKNDLDDRFEVAREAALAALNGADTDYLTVSALTGDGVNELFMRAARLGFGYAGGAPEKAPEPEPETVTLVQAGPEPMKGCC
jgi:small GTP-binding protein